MNATLSRLRSQNQADLCPPSETDSRSVLVPGISRKIEVKVAAEAAEWEAAFRLVRENYLASGYEAPSTKLFRFTPYHALPDTTVFVAKCEGKVVATLTLVPDNRPLGLPMESLYEQEVNDLRTQGRRLGEVTSLASIQGEDALSQREFMQVFITLIRVMGQYHASLGGDTWVLTCNPRHRNFYVKAIGYQALGPQRAYEFVEGAPAEAYWIDEETNKRVAPKMHAQLFESLPDEVLAKVEMSAELIREFAAGSSQIDALDCEQILSYVSSHERTRRW